MNNELCATIERNIDKALHGRTVLDVSRAINQLHVKCEDGSTLEIPTYPSIHIPIMVGCNYVIPMNIDNIETIIALLESRKAIPPTPNVYRVRAVFQPLKDEKAFAKLWSRTRGYYYAVLTTTHRGITVQELLNDDGNWSTIFFADLTDEELSIIQASFPWYNPPRNPNFGPYVADMFGGYYGSPMRQRIDKRDNVQRFAVRVNGEYVDDAPSRGEAINLAYGLNQRHWKIALLSLAQGNQTVLI